MPTCNWLAVTTWTKSLLNISVSVAKQSFNMFCQVKQYSTLA